MKIDNEIKRDRWREGDSWKETADGDRDRRKEEREKWER